jgi:hypothetical protein
MDLSTPVRRLLRPTMLDSVLRIGHDSPAGYACGRILFPFRRHLLWSAILAVDAVSAASPPDRPVRQRWSALLIGVVGVAINDRADRHRGNIAGVVVILWSRACRTKT